MGGMSTFAPLSDGYLTTFEHAYMVCLLWSQVDATTGENFPGHSEGPDAFTPEARRTLAWEALDFIAANEADLAEIDPESAGHDFALTRAGHGTGFWDRGLGEVGQRLSDASSVYGDVDLWSLPSGSVEVS